MIEKAMMKADLHCHSRFSDGSLTIRDLVALAARLGIKALGIVDHDTVKGHLEAEKAGRDYQVAIIPGIEISAFDYKRKQKAHVLGYLMDDPQIVGEACQGMIRERQENSRWIVNTLIGAGYPLEWDFVKRLAVGSTNVYKQHIMHALMEMGYASTLKGELYKTLFAKPTASTPPGVAYKELSYMDVTEAVGLIKKAGGVAVLAHPHGYNNLDLIPELVPLGLDGLEAWHPSHDEAAVEEIISIAEQYDLTVTGGSDFHGLYEGEANSLGSCCATWDWLERLYRRR